MTKDKDCKPMTPAKMKSMKVSIPSKKKPGKKK